MYLSKLELNPASRQVIAELKNPYQMHRTLSKAFNRESDSYKRARVLFRVENLKNGSVPYALVQALVEPDWSFLDSNGSYLASPPQTKQVNPVFSRGQLLRFRLLANPTVKRNGKRLGLQDTEQQIQWLRRKGEQHGFTLHSVDADFRGRAISPDINANHIAVLFNGVLEVTDSVAFGSAVETGIGSAKGFGFGLLSVAPLR
jgi:CRISPR system Cascade subunit CasE